MYLSTSYVVWTYRHRSPVRPFQPLKTRSHPKDPEMLHSPLISAEHRDRGRTPTALSIQVEDGLDGDTGRDLKKGTNRVPKRAKRPGKE